MFYSVNWICIFILCTKVEWQKKWSSTLHLQSVSLGHLLSLFVQTCWCCYLPPDCRKSGLFVNDERVVPVHWRYDGFRIVQFIIIGLRIGWCIEAMLVYKSYSFLCHKLSANAGHVRTVPLNCCRTQFVKKVPAKVVPRASVTLLRGYQWVNYHSRRLAILWIAR